MWLWMVACSGDVTPIDQPVTDVTIPTDDTVPTGTTESADSGTTTPGPSTVEVACATTDNALRFLCDVTVDPAQPVRVTWMRQDGLGVARSQLSDEVVGTHQVPVLFLSPEQAYDVAVTTLGATPAEASTELTAGGAPLPGLVTWLQSTGTSTLGLVGTEAPCMRSAVATVYDTATGDLVWYQDLDSDGSLGLIDMVRYLPDFRIIGDTGGAGRDIVEVDVMGNEITRFVHSYGGCCSLNHDVVKWRDWYVSQYQSSVNGLTVDNVVVLDAKGNEVYLWDAKANLPIPPDTFSRDYLHTNSEFVDADGNLYLSWFTPSALAKIEGDPNKPTWGAPAWIMTGDGQPGDLGNDLTIDWGTISTPHNFVRQHNFTVRADGRLMVLDNVNGRALVFSVDEAKGTATMEAEFPTYESSCGPQGTAMEGGNGNTLVSCASPWVREYDPATSKHVWEAQIQCPNGGGGGFTSGAATRWYPLDAWHEALLPE